MAQGDYCQTGLSLSFINNATGWALCVVEDGGPDMQKVLYQTTDGGKQWSVIAASGTTTKGALPLAGAASGIRFVSAEQGWMGYISEACPAEVWETSDGGHTWNAEVLSGSGTNAAFPCSTSTPLFANGEGLLVSGGQTATSVYEYSDSAPRWVQARTLPDTVGEVAALSANVLLGVKKSGHEAFPHDPLLSEDGGQTWTPFTLPSGVSVSGGADLVSSSDLWTVATLNTQSLLLHGIRANGMWTWQTSSLPE